MGVTLLNAGLFNILGGDTLFQTSDMSAVNHWFPRKSEARSHLAETVSRVWKDPTDDLIL